MQMTIRNGTFKVTDLPPPVVKFKKFIFTYWRDILKIEPSMYKPLFGGNAKLNLDTCWSDGSYAFFQVSVKTHSHTHFHCKIPLTDLMMLPSLSLTKDSFNIEYVGLGCFMLQLHNIGERNLQAI